MSVSKKIGLLIIGIIALTGAGMLSSTTFAELLLNTFQGGKVTSNLVAQWSFDGRFLDTTSSTAEVKDGTGTHNGNWLNHSTTTDIGKLGQALYFDGYDDKVSVADDNALDFTGTDDFSISLWFNSTASSTLIENPPLTGTSSIYWNAYNTGNAWATSPANLVDGSTTTYAQESGSGNTHRNTTNTAGATTTGAVPTLVQIRLHGYASGNDDIDIQPYYAGTTAGTSNTYQTTASGAYSPWYNVTADNSPWTWTDIVDMEVQLTKNNDQGPDVVFASIVEMEVGYTAATTTETYFFDATTTLFSKADSTSGGYKIYLQGDGDLCFAIDDDGTWGPEDEVCTSGMDYSDTSDWHHVIASKDGTSGIYLYVDDPNTPVASSTTLTATGDLSNASPLYIGDDGEGSYDEYVGLLDEVALYSSVLTQPERERLYSLGQTMVVNASQMSKQREGLTAYWSFDGNGVNIADATVRDDGPYLEAVFETDSFDVEDGLIIMGKDTTDIFGRSVSSAGDTNGDGFDDFLVGTHFDEDTGSGQGRAYLYLGPLYGTTSIEAESADFIFNGTNNSDQFGISVAHAGDVNNDGYADLIMGAFQAEDTGTNRGRAYLFFGPFTGLQSIAAENADVIFNGAVDDDDFGIDVSSAGDVNGDGYSDVIVGANNASDTGTIRGRAYLFLGPLTGTSSVDAENADVVFNGAADNDEFGFAVGSAGDVNNDTYDDLIIGAYQAEDVGGSCTSNCGKAYLFLGPFTGTSSIDAENADVVFNGELDNDDLGNSVGTAGDANGDTYDDIIVGANGADNAGTSNGSVYLFYGPLTGTTSVNAENADVIFDGSVEFDNFGISVSGGRDVNGDGYSDLLVGAHGAEDAGVWRGRSYLFYGPFTGTTSVFAQSANVVFNGEVDNDYSGYAVAIAGDTNGDGYEEILVGAYQAEYSSATCGGASGDNCGAAYLFTPLKKTTGRSFSPTPEVGRIGQALSFDGIDQLASIIAEVATTTSISFWVKADDTTSRPLIMLNDLASIELDSSGNASTTGSGWSASTTIYVDRQTTSLAITNDWHHIVVIDEQGLQATSTALGYSGGTYFDGMLDEVRFYSDVLTKDEINKLYAQGGTFVLNAPQKEKQRSGLIGYWTFDGPDMIASTAYDVAPNPAVGLGTTSANAEDADSILNGTTDTDYFGEALASAGDVNNDGYEDYIVAARYGEDIGGSCTVTGACGLVYIFHGPLSAGQINAENADTIFRGEVDYDFFGYSVASAGDVDNDGYDDVLVGAYTATDAGTERGEAYLFLGPFAATVDSENADVIFYGINDLDSLGHAVSGAGDVNNDGYDDIIMSAPGAGEGGGDSGSVYLFHGPLTGTTSVNVEVADVAFVGPKTSDRFGDSISAAGDVNNDGYDDFIVGADQAEDTGSGRGQAFLFMGPFTGTTSISAKQADVTFNGADDSDNFGDAVSGGGDINGDTYDDVIVGADQAEDGGGSCTAGTGNCGAVYAFYGPFTGTTSIDAENADLVINGESNSDSFGYSVSVDGDINGDGYADILVGALNDEDVDGGDCLSNCGRALLYYGPFTGTTSINGEDADVAFNGQHDSDRFGNYVASAADMNGDGYKEVLVGAYQDEDTGSLRGRAYLFSPSQISAASITNAKPDIGRIGQGMSFDGTGDEATVGDMSAAGTLRSVSFWMKADVTNSPIMNLGSVFSDGIGMNSWEVSATGFGSPTYYVDAVSGEQTVSTDWHHVVVTDATGVSPDNVIFGSSNAVYFNGVLDEIRFYDYVLSHEEVKKLYLQGK